MKRSLIVALCILGMLTNASAELRRKKNTATYVTFEIFNASTGALITGATGLDCERSGYDDGTNPPTYSDVNGTETEIGTTGTYYVALNAADTNFDFVSLQCKSTSTNAVTWTERINTKYGAVTTASDGSLGDSTIRGLSFVSGGTISAESGTTLSVGTGSLITANDQFNTGFKIQVYSTSGVIEATSCIVDTVQGTPDQVVTREDITAAIAVSDPFDILSDEGCTVADVTVAQLSSAPGTGTLSLGTMVRYLYQRFAHAVKDNRVTNEIEMYKADGTTKVVECDRSDSGTVFSVNACGTPD